MKYLFKLMNRHDLPWVRLIWQAHYNQDNLPQSSGPCGSFWGKDYLSLMDNFLSIFSCTAGTGDTLRLWRDKWIMPTLLQSLPHLCSYAKDQNISFKQAADIANNDGPLNYFTPLSNEAAIECNTLNDHFLNRGDQLAVDKWFDTSRDISYSSSRVYK